MGCFFKERREALGLAQHEVASLAGVSQGEVSRVERHVGTPRLNVFVETALSSVETNRDVEPRVRRLAPRRKRLGLSVSDLAERAFFRTGCEKRVIRAELGVGDPADVAAIRRALVFEESAERRKREDLRRENQRIAHQRALWAALPDCPEKAALQEAMLRRCIDLMDVGQGEATDAIAEWLPEFAVGAMFDEWEFGRDKALEETQLPSETAPTFGE